MPRSLSEDWFRRAHSSKHRREQQSHGQSHFRHQRGIHNYPYINDSQFNNSFCNHISNFGRLSFPLFIILVAFVLCILGWCYWWMQSNGWKSSLYGNICLCMFLNLCYTLNSWLFYVLYAAHALWNTWIYSKERLYILSWFSFEGCWHGCCRWFMWQVATKYPANALPHRPTLLQYIVSSKVCIVDSWLSSYVHRLSMRVTRAVYFVLLLCSTLLFLLLIGWQLCN